MSTDSDRTEDTPVRTPRSFFRRPVQSFTRFFTVVAILSTYPKTRRLLPHDLRKRFDPVILSVSIASWAFFQKWASFCFHPLSTPLNPRSWPYKTVHYTMSALSAYPFMELLVTDMIFQTNLVRDRIFRWPLVVLGLANCYLNATHTMAIQAARAKRQHFSFVTTGAGLGYEVVTPPPSRPLTPPTPDSTDSNASSSSSRRLDHTPPPSKYTLRDPSYLDPIKPQIWDTFMVEGCVRNSVTLAFNFEKEGAKVENIAVRISMLPPSIPRVEKSNLPLTRKYAPPIEELPAWMQVYRVKKFLHFYDKERFTKTRWEIGIDQKSYDQLEKIPFAFISLLALIQQVLSANMKGPLFSKHHPVIPFNPSEALPPITWPDSMAIPDCASLFGTEHPEDFCFPRQVKNRIGLGNMQGKQPPAYTLEYIYIGDMAYPYYRMITYKHRGSNTTGAGTVAVEPDERSLPSITTPPPALPERHPGPLHTCEGISPCFVSLFTPYTPTSDPDDTPITHIFLPKNVVTYLEGLHYTQDQMKTLFFATDGYKEPTKLPVYFHQVNDFPKFSTHTLQYVRLHGSYSD